jgi:hypothetical protein
VTGIFSSLINFAVAPVETISTPALLSSLANSANPSLLETLISALLIVVLLI